MPSQKNPVTVDKPRTLSEAQAFIARSYSPVAEIETIAAGSAIGRVLASDIVAPVALPRFAASAMDGFAVRDADVRGDAARVLRVTGTAKAGHPFAGSVAPGEAVRIYTGAPIPPGTDRVVMQEDCHFKDGRVVLTGALSRKRHIRMPGEDVARGEILLRAGSTLTAANISILAACGMDKIGIRRRLKVALFSTGDELVEACQLLGPGQIYDCNRPYLKLALEQMGCEVDDLGIVPDDRDALIAHLVEAAAAHDLIVTSGGASAGAEDHVAALVGRRGYLEFWRLSMKPGKPVGLGDIDDCPLLMLPGNPMAAAATCKFLGEPLVGRLAGHAECLPPMLRLPLASALNKISDKLELLAARIIITPNACSVAEVLPAQGSANVAALSQSRGWVLLPEAAREFHAGDLVDYYPARRDWH